MTSFLTKSTSITCFLLLSASLFAQEISDTWNFPEARQFDFWIGEWKVQNRFKQADGSWREQGGARVKIFPALNGKAVIEFWNGTARDWKETRGFSLRYFDPETRKWQLALNWPQKDNGGFFFLEGEFRHNRGEFFSGRETQDGGRILNRYTFSDITPNSLRWDSSTSLDGGKTWETKWIMEFSRTADAPEWPAVDEAFHTYDSDKWNTTDEGKQFEQLPGRWRGTLERDGADQGATRDIETNVWPVLNGIAYLLEMHAVDGDPFSEIMMLTYRDMNKVWLLLSLDNRKESDFNVYAWKVEDGTPVFKTFSGDEKAEVTLEWRELSEDSMLLIRTDKEKNMTTRLRLQKVGKKGEGNAEKN